MKEIKAVKGFLVDGKLSWSQLQVWEKSPRQYIKKYINGEKTFVNKYMLFGTMIHDAIAQGSAEDEQLNMLITLVPRIGNPNTPLTADFTIGKTVVHLNGYADDADLVTDRLIEYKAAKEEDTDGDVIWSQEIAEEHGQLKFYGLIHLINVKRYLNTELVHIHSTEDKDGELGVTGEFEVYNKTINPDDIADIMERIAKFVKWCENLTPEMLETEPSKKAKAKIAKMVKIKAKMDLLETQLNGLKNEVKEEMETSGALEYKTELASLYYSTKSKYAYPKELVDLKEQYDEKKSAFENENEPVEVSKVLNFKPITKKANKE